jgi:hypothetical protein
MMTQTHEQALARLELLSDWMDRRYVDPMLGLLLPGVGDALGAAIGLYGVRVAVSAGAHPLVVARMLINLALDAILGAVPLFGAIGDFFFRAHTRNVALLRARRAERVRVVDYVVVMVAALAFLVALALPIVIATWLLSWVFHALR